MQKTFRSPGAIMRPAHDHMLPGVAANGPGWKPHLLLREQLPVNGDRSRPVLYIHGATFPSATSILFKFEGLSWADSLNAAGFNVFGLDFAGYGGSERYPAMTGNQENVGEPLGRCAATVEQVERAVLFIIKETGCTRISIIAHSWGTTVAGRFASQHPAIVDRLVLFGPIGLRHHPRSARSLTPWTYITVDQQYARFVKDAPRDAPVLVETDFPRWAEAYLASDPTSRSRTPASVQTPNGPAADIGEAWCGSFPYDPSLIEAPTLIVRGAWDSTSATADMAWLKAALTASPKVEDIIIPRATHLMHLEDGRHALYAVTNAFLTEGSAAGGRVSA